MAERNEETERDEGAEKGKAEAAKAEADEGALAAAPAEAPLEADAEAAAPTTASAPRKKARAKAKAASEGSTGTGGESRDRNRRIREEAAAKRRGRADDGGERRAAVARNLDATEIVDDALARSTHAIGGWLKRNFQVLQWGVLLLIVGGLSYQVYAYRHRLSVARATEELNRGIAAELGRIGTPAAPAADEYTGLGDPRPAYVDEAQRLKAAESEYRKVQASGSGSVSALATLGLAGILYDQGKYADARSAYESVKNSELGKQDRDARARAIEGVGLSSEALGQNEPASRAYRELENSDMPGFGALGLYHQARFLIAQGKRDAAKEPLKKALDKLSKADEKDKAPSPNAAPGFLESQLRELMASVDPSALPKPAAGLTPEQLQRLQMQLQGQAAGGKLDGKKLEELLKQMGGSGGPAPAQPPQSAEGTPAPAGSAP